MAIEKIKCPKCKKIMFWDHYNDEEYRDEYEEECRGHILCEHCDTYWLVIRSYDIEDGTRKTNFYDLDA